MSCSGRSHIRGLRASCYTVSQKTEDDAALASKILHTKMDGIDKQAADFFASEGQRLGFSDLPGSRRVILHSLPPGISLHSVLEAISAPEDQANGTLGGIVSAHVFDDPSSPAREKDRCAMIEFVHPSTAKAYVKLVKDSEVHFEVDKTECGNSLHKLQAYLAPSDSNALRPETIYMLLAEQTRTLMVPVCPPDLVWELLCTIGLSNIARTDYISNSGSLKIEFVGMFEADRAYDLLCSGHLHHRFPTCELLPPHFTADSTQRGFETVQGRNIPVAYHPVATTFTQEPWNCTSNSSVKSPLPFFRPSFTHRICLRNDILPHELLDWLQNRADFEPQHYRIHISRISITRKAYGWHLDPDSRIKLLLSSSLNDPNLAEAWDDYFQLGGLPNLRRYEAYGKLSSRGSGTDQTDEDEDDDDEEDDDTTDASNTEHSHPESAFTSIHSSFTQDMLSLNEGIAVKKGSVTEVDLDETSSNSTNPATPKSQKLGVDMSWLMPATDPWASKCPEGVNSVLIPDIGAEESGSWDAVDYEDWLGLKQGVGLAIESAGEVQALGEAEDLMVF